MITLQDVSVSFGGDILFDEISFMVNRGDRVGLVGKNGAGKSTLLKLISGEEVPTSGHIASEKELQVGYLKQDLDFVDGRTVYEEAEHAFEDHKRIEKRLHDLREQLAEHPEPASDEYMKLVEETGELEEKFNMMGGYSLQGEIGKILRGLGFKDEDLGRQTTEFSGGWRMRIELAKILLAHPDLLLLDEPTNHLDIESIIWLEQWLKGFSGALLLVSHDRKFLDSVTNRTIEITVGNIYDYKASYSKFVKLREERRERQLQEKKNQDKEIARYQQQIEKFRYKKSKAAFAQSLIKKVEKMERVEVDAMEKATVHFKFPPAPHSGKVTLEAQGIGKKYGEQVVLQGIDLQVERGEKLAFVGRNGEGKTTLAKIIAGELDHEGSLKLGHKVKLGYYAQDQSDQLDGNMTVFETVESSANESVRPKVRDILGSFLFSGDDVNKKVKVLSGGERARVALCKLLLEPVNFLVMDEPTNHLDMTSKDILKNALKDYDGTLILVSHDRDFLQGLTDKVFEFRDQKVMEHPGDLQSFLDKRKAEDLEALQQGSSEPKGKKDSKKGKESSQKDNYHQRKELNKSLQKTQKEVNKLEKKIEKEEAEVQKLEKELMDPEKFQELSEQGLFEEHKKKKGQLDKLLADWEKSQEKYDSLKKKWDKKFG